MKIVKTGAMKPQNFNRVVYQKKVFSWLLNSYLTYLFLKYLITVWVRHFAIRNMLKINLLNLVSQRINTPIPARIPNVQAEL
jgi:hypothetical protein